MRFIGTNLSPSADDLSGFTEVNQTVSSAITASGLPDGFNSNRLEKTGTTGYITDSVALTASDYYLAAFVRATGTGSQSRDTAEFRLRSGGVNYCDEVAVIHGEGTVSIDGTGPEMRITGLAADNWTLIRMGATLGAATYEIRISAGLSSGTVGDAFELGPIRLYDQADAGWVFDTPAQVRDGGVFKLGGGVLLEGQRFLNAAPNAEIDIARGQSWLFHVLRGSTSAETVAEKWEDASNYWRLHITAGGSVVFNCVLGGSNIGASTAAGAVANGASAEIIAVIPASGNCKIYVNGSDATSTTAGTLSTAGTGLVLGARYDGTEAWTGKIQGAYALSAEVSGGDAQSIYTTSNPGAISIGDRFRSRLRIR